MYNLTYRKGSDKIMRILTTQEIEGILTKNPKSRRTAVENFLTTMGDSKLIAMTNLGYDAKSYRWNTTTVRAIAQGINLACR